MSTAEESNVTVRPMRRKDVFPVLEMFKKMPDARGSLTYSDLTNWGLGKERDVSFVAEIEKKVVGMVLARFSFLGIPVAEACSIHVIVVDPDYLRQRIGAKLIDAILKRCYAEGVNTVRTFFDQKKWERKIFFENIGFEPSGLAEYVITVKI